MEKATPNEAPIINVHDHAALEQLRRELQLDPLRIRQFRTSLLKHFASDEEVNLKSPSGRVQLHSLVLHQRVDSQLDGATKLLFRTSSGMLIESVILRIATGRTTLCVSSQVGCAAACDFCATGKMGIARDLPAHDILDQIVQAGQLLAREGRRLRNIVFMGMGEPLHNEEGVYGALEDLLAAEHFHFAPSRILVSTVGVTDAMLRCVKRFPDINLALSLHSVNSTERERLIPLAKKYPLDKLRATIEAINRLQDHTVMIEYLMLAGVNDAEDDARKLAGWLAGLQVHVNLIPFNPIADAPHLTGSDEATRKRFADAVRDAGFQVTTRYSLGDDIAAACGQLVQRENRKRA